MFFCSTTVLSLSTCYKHMHLFSLQLSLTYMHILIVASCQETIASENQFAFLLVIVFNTFHFFHNRLLLSSQIRLNKVYQMRLVKKKKPRHRQRSSVQMRFPRLQHTNYINICQLLLDPSKLKKRDCCNFLSLVVFEKLTSSNLS